MKVIIVSDFHLSYNPKTTEQKERNEAVLSFLNTLENRADMLIMAGDIFDLWYDWNSTIIKGYFPFLKKLADLTESGCKLVFIAGNHDFWFGDFLSDYLNCEVFKQNFTREIDGKRLFVSHGDSYTVNDRRYHVLHKIIRNRISRFLFSIIHPNLSLAIGTWISRTSRARTVKLSPADNKQMNGLESYAKQIADKYDIIVMGHSHQTIHKQINNATYINTGYWGTDNSYVEINNGQVKLLTNKIVER